MPKPEVADEVKKVFDEFDESGDGEISKGELKVALKRLGQSPTEFDLCEMMRAYDRDCSGTIDVVEFQAMILTCEMMKKATMPRFRRRGGFVDLIANKSKKDQDSIEDDEGEDSSFSEDSQTEEGRCTPNIKVLALTATLFGAITALQTVGAVMAHSKCLLADCVSMGVDSCTYLGNIAVECQKGTKWYKPLELMVGGVSLAILIYFTFVVMAEALGTILGRGAGEEEEEVNGYIVLFFACLGIAFDCASLYAFRTESEGAGEAANMWTALMHVGADFLRSCTTLVSSVLMLFFNVDTSTVDSYAALILGITILGGALFGIVELLKSADQASAVVGAVIGVVGFLIYLAIKSI